MFRLSNVVVAVLALALVVGITMPVVAAEAMGKIKSVDTTKNQIVVTDANQKDWTFNVSKDAKIFADEKQCQLSDLKRDENVTIRYDKDKDGVLMATEIRCKTK